MPSKQGEIKESQDPGWFGRNLGFQQNLLVKLFKVTTMVDLLVVL
jgi:hypothetical protein